MRLSEKKRAAIARGRFSFYSLFMIRASFLLALAVGSGLFVSSPAALAASASAKSLGKFGYWNAYQMAEGKDPVCYLAMKAKPPEVKGSKLRRGDVTLMITHRPAESALDVVSYAAGIKLKPSSDMKVQVGGREFDLFTQDDTAWSRDAATDKALSLALRSASSATFTGVSASGKPLADAVNLKGAAEAYYAASKACGVAVEKPRPAPKAAPVVNAKTPVHKKR